MSYSTYEGSVQDGQPVYLYKFVLSYGTAAGATTVVTENWEYSTQSDAEAAEWSFSGTGILVGATDQYHSGSRSLKFSDPSSTAIAQRTFGPADGLAPNTSYLIEVWGRQSAHEEWDTNTRIDIGTTTDYGANVSLVNTWEKLSIIHATDSAGELLIKLKRQINFANASPVWWDDLRIKSLAVPPVLPGNVGTYTSDGLSHVFRGDTYEPAIFALNGFEWGSGEVAGGEVELTMPRDHAVAQLMRGGVPVAPLTCTIYRVHRPDIAAGTSFATPFVGQVTQARIKGANCVLTLSNARSLMDGKRPRVRCQKQCNWSLGDDYCGVNLADYAYTEGTITAISGKTVTVSGLATAAGADHTRFQFGFLVGPSGESCQIEKQDSSTGSDSVVLMAQPRTLEVGQAVTVHWGCDLSTGATGCGRFGNIARFGGFPKIPTRNPYVGAGVLP